MRIKSILICLILNFIGSSFSQTNTVVLLDKKYENEPYYYDLSYLNSNYHNIESLQTKYSIRDRSGTFTNKHSCSLIKSIPSNIRNDLKLKYFYQKYTEAYGIPIIGSNKVTANGLKRACYVVRYYLASNPDVREVFYKRNLRVVVMSSAENLLNVPEYSQLPSQWSNVRGLSPTPQIPLITIGEENFQCNNDKYRNEDLLVHQLSYALVTLDALDSDMKRKLNDYYEYAKSVVPWESSFYMVDRKEYLATVIDLYLNAATKNELSINDLNRYDPMIVNLVRGLFPCENVYLSKCKSNREAEMNQVLKLKSGSMCEYENPSAGVSYIISTLGTTLTYPTTTFLTTPITTSNNRINLNRVYSSNSSSTTSTRVNNAYRTDYQFINIMKEFNRQQQQQQEQNEIMSEKRKTTTSTRPFYTSFLDTTKITTSTFKYIEECENLNSNCELWSAKGECNRNRQFMSIECRKSCNLCGELRRETTKRLATTTTLDLSVFESLCKDEFTHCPVFALRGDCKTNPHHMLDKCKRSCNLCGDLVQQKDRIQPTSKKTILRRPNIIYPTQSTNSPFDNWNRMPEYTDATTTRYVTRTLSQNNWLINNPSKSSSSSTKFTTTTTTTTAQRSKQKAKDEETKPCTDLASHCFDLASRGDCKTNEPTMRYYCSKSCKFC